ncbi:MAG: bacillithiol system redox-active protein YtxJ [Rhodothermaceae bacterium]|nr:bacillithiol system redox-active protein YtxJ [Rhodothermaceae bacterium]
MASVTPLHTPADAEAMLAASQTQPVALLKHSAACMVSARGQRVFMQLAEHGDLPLYMVTVQQARMVSSALAERLGVRHETPQAFIVYQGEPVIHQSHGSIRAEDLRAAAHQAARRAA